MATDVEMMFREYAAAWSSHDVEKVASFFTDDCVYEDVAAGALVQGKEGVRAWASGAFASFSGFGIEVKSFFVAGNRAGSEWIMSGTHSGDVGQMPATGRSFSIRGTSIIELYEGKIRRITDYWDFASMLRQLGALPGAASD